MKEKVLKLIRNNEKWKKAILLVMLIPIAVIAFAVRSNADSEIPPEEDIPEISEDADWSVSDVSDTSGTIYVDIGGAVKQPMLAELPSGSRVEDAIVAAGGLTDNADLTTINRAEYLEDGEKIYIPKYADELNQNYVNGYVGTDGLSSNAVNSTGSTGKININTADSAQLQELNGVGPSTAQKIIDYRTSNGRFQSIEDIKNVSGIGDKTFENLTDDITT